VVGIFLAALRAVELGVLAGVLVVAGWAVGAARLHAIDAPQRALHAGGVVAGRAYLLERPRFGPFGSSAEVQLVSGRARGAHMLARSDGVAWPAGVRPGAELELTGSAEPPKRSAGDSFGYPAYLRRRGIHFELALNRVRATGRERGGGRPR